jgi:hypothetical protein
MAASVASSFIVGHEKILLSSLSEDRADDIVSQVAPLQLIAEQANIRDDRKERFVARRYLYAITHKLLVFHGHLVVQRIDDMFNTYQELVLLADDFGKTVSRIFVAATLLRDGVEANESFEASYELYMAHTNVRPVLRRKLHRSKKKRNTKKPPSTLVEQEPTKPVPTWTIKPAPPPESTNVKPAPPKLKPAAQPRGRRPGEECGFFFQFNLNNDETIFTSSCPTRQSPDPAFWRPRRTWTERCRECLWSRPPKSRRADRRPLCETHKPNHLYINATK